MKLRTLSEERLRDCHERRRIVGWYSILRRYPQARAGRQKLSRAVLECGALFSVSSKCRGTIELSCFLNVIDYLVPIGKAAEKVIDEVNKRLKGVAEIEVNSGINGNVTIEVCKGKDRGLVSPEFCLGGFIEIGGNLSTDKKDYAGTTTPPAPGSGSSAEETSSSSPSLSSE
jgi:hypothetical protein